MKKYVLAVKRALAYNWMLLAVNAIVYSALLLSMQEGFLFSVITFSSIWFIIGLPMLLPASILACRSNRSLKLFEMFLFFSPWFLAVVLYENLTGLTTYIDLPLADEPLYVIDVLMFGETPSVYLEPLITPALTHVIFAIYVLGYVFPPLLLGAYIFLRKGRDSFSEYSYGVTMCLLTGFLIYLLVPAIGPADYYNILYEKNLYGETILSYEIMETVQVYSKNAFPSMHTALSTLVLLFAFKNNKRIFYLLIPLTLLIWFSTIYLRQHYFIDLVAGWMLASIIYYCAPVVASYAKKYGSRILKVPADGM